MNENNNGFNVIMNEEGKVTISLDEYRDLLLNKLSESVEARNDRMLFNRMKDLIVKEITYKEKYNKDISINFKDYYDFGNELIKIIEIIQPEFYNKMLKQVQKEYEQAKEKEDKENVDN